MIVVVIRAIFFAIFAFVPSNTNPPSAMAVQRHSLYSKRQVAGLTLRYGTVLLLYFKPTPQTFLLPRMCKNPAKSVIRRIDW
jgi:hypothetical protein